MNVPSVKAESRFPAWERIVARPLMAVLGASTTLKEIAEAVSGAAANPDYRGFRPAASPRWLTSAKGPRCCRRTGNTCGG